MIEKLKEREFILALTAIITYLLTLTGYAPQAGEVEKIISGVVAGIGLVAYIISRTSIKKADLRAGADAVIEEIKAGGFPTGTGH
jgi:hypothetical protein